MPFTPPLITIAVEAGATNPPGRSLLHGDAHWRCVAIMGLHIAKHTPGVDPNFITTFAQLHDICRLNDDGDPEHGIRAAALFTEIADSPGIETFGQYSDRATAMFHALANHCNSPAYLATEQASSREFPPELDLSIAACWDADRLNLWRVGETPDPAYLSTPVAKSHQSLAMGYRLCQLMHSLDRLPTWEDIYTHQRVGDLR